MSASAITAVTVSVPNEDVSAIVLEARDRGLRWRVIWTSELPADDGIRWSWVEVQTTDTSKSTMSEFIAWFEAAKSTLSEMRA